MTDERVHEIHPTQTVADAILHGVAPATPTAGADKPRKRGPGKKINRYRRVAADAAKAGVGSTESRPFKPEHMPREDRESGEEVSRMSLDERQLTGYDLPEHRKKPGWDYKWEVTTVLGQPVLRSVMADTHRSGWRAERCGDWPEIAPGTAKAEDPLEEGGLILMSRPMRLSHEAHTEMYNKAKTQEFDSMRAAAGGVDARGSGQSLGQIRGVQVDPRAQSLQVELAVGSGPIPTKRG